MILCHGFDASATIVTARSGNRKVGTIAFSDAVSVKHFQGLRRHAFGLIVTEHAFGSVLLIAHGAHVEYPAKIIFI